MTIIRKRLNQDTLPSVSDIFDSFFEDMPTRLHPRMELEENDNFYFLRAELPGMTKEDLNISFENNLLTVGGEKKEPAREENSRYHFSEIYYGKFSRSFKMPGNIHADKINAEFKDGILMVSIPKTEQAKPRKIEIK